MFVLSLLYEINNSKVTILLNDTNEVGALIYKMYIGFQNTTVVANCAREIGLKILSEKNHLNYRVIYAKEVAEVIDEHEIENKVLQNYTRLLYNKKRAYKDNWNIKV